MKKKIDSMMKEYTKTGWAAVPDRLIQKELDCYGLYGKLGSAPKRRMTAKRRQELSDYVRGVRRPAAIAVHQPCSVGMSPGSCMTDYQLCHNLNRPWWEGARMLWYLASPISGMEILVAERRIACRKAQVKLVTNGYLVYCPHLHWSDAVRFSGLPKAWSFWKSLSLDMLRNCHGLLVLQLPGWTTSAGVAAEIKYAREKGMPVLLLPADGNPNEAIPYETEALRNKRLDRLTKKIFKSKARRSNG